MLIIRRSAAVRGVLRRPPAACRVPCAYTRPHPTPLCARLHYSPDSGRGGWLSRIAEWAGFRDAPGDGGAPSPSPSPSPSSSSTEPPRARILDSGVEDAPEQHSAMAPVVEAGVSFSPVDDAEAKPQLRRMRLTKESRKVIVDAIDAFGSNDVARRQCAERFDVPVMSIAEQSEGDEAFWRQLLRQFRKQVLAVHGRPPRKASVQPCDVLQDDTARWTGAVIGTQAELEALVEGVRPLAERGAAARRRHLRGPFAGTSAGGDGSAGHSESFDNVLSQLGFGRPHVNAADSDSSSASPSASTPESKLSGNNALEALNLRSQKRSNQAFPQAYAVEELEHRDASDGDKWEVVITCNETRINASGGRRSTKKRSRHAAAEALLELLKQDDSYGSGSAGTATPVAEEDAAVARAIELLLPLVGTFVERELGASIASRRALLHSADLCSPHNFYPDARALAPRRIIYHAGPTNSGKTHSAIEALAAAESGVYCAPLRLLAHEVYERLNDKGVPCSLLTGQEQREEIGARHMACTVEMAHVSTRIELEMERGLEQQLGSAPVDLEAQRAQREEFAALGADRLPGSDDALGVSSSADSYDYYASSAIAADAVAEEGQQASGGKGRGPRYDVAVIDEIQMIGDAQRGWAWSRALAGVAAEEVHLCGDASALPLVRRMAEQFGDVLEEREYARRTPLRVAPRGNSLRGSLARVQPGDCIVGFSRRALHQLKLEVEDATGLRCCLIYGSLPPETRTQQAALFNDPNSGYDVLVATDAIGMGLNLNIRRLVFAAMQKFNGQEVVPLTPSQIRQIGGRAGRWGSRYPEGTVTTLVERDLPLLREGMGADEETGLVLDQPLEDHELLFEAGLFPCIDQVEHFAGVLNRGRGGVRRSDRRQHSLAHLLQEFVRTARVDGQYFVCNIEDHITLARNIEHADWDGRSSLALRDAFVFASAPVSSRNVFALRRLAGYAADHAQGVSVRARIRLPPSAPTNELDLQQLENKHAALDCYLWLAQRFPHTFVSKHRDRALATRDRCIELIEQGLAQLSLESLERKKTQRRGKRRLYKDETRRRRKAVRKRGARGRHN